MNELNTKTSFLLKKENKDVEKINQRVEYKNKKRKSTITWEDKINKIKEEKKDKNEDLCMHLGLQRGS